jgi:hypothetical protein
LGKHDWLSPYPLPNGKIGVHVKMPQYDGRIPMTEYVTAKGKVEYLNINGLHSELIETWTLSRILANGPKLFRPTLLQCEAMANVDIEIPLSEYAQAYPVIIFQYPTEFVEAMARKYGVARFPSLAVSHHDAAKGFVQVSSVFKEKDAITALLAKRDDNSTIEDILRRRPEGTDNDAEFEMGETLQRIALNFSLMMTHYRVTHKPMDPDAWAKHRKMAGSTNERKREQGRKFQLTDVQIVSFEQHIELYEERRERAPRSDGEPTGRQMPPHWRKGHWRMQPHGPQNSLRKRKLMKAVFVRRDRFFGDEGNTTVVYDGRDPK